MGALRGDAARSTAHSTTAALAWRYRGELRVTVIAKATFAFVLDDAMTRLPPQEILRDEQRYDDHPAHSERLTTDLSPYLEGADVLFTGHAHVPRGASSSVRLELRARAGAPLLSKALVVRAHEGVVADAARERPLERVPLVYERALGGIGWAQNPFGVGVRDGAEPSVIDAQEPRRPGGFGPIGQAWPARKALLGGLPRRALSAEIVALPDDFAWEYFRAAPQDQRLAEFLRGDEWLVLEGLNPVHAALRTRLPDATGLARIEGLSGFGIEEDATLALHADTLRIDGDAETCTLTFRGVFPVPSEEALEALTVLASVQSCDAPFDWSEPIRRERTLVLRSAEAAPRAMSAMQGTLVIEPPRSTTAEAQSFDGTMEVAPDAILEVVPHEAPLPEGTIELGATAAPDSLPFTSRASFAPSPELRLAPTRPAPATSAPRDPLSGTAEIAPPEDEDLATRRRVTPFGRAPAPSLEPQSPSQSQSQSQSPSPSQSQLPPPSLAQVPLAAPPAPTPWAWAPAEIAPPAPPARSAPPPAPAVASESLKKSLYGRFSKLR